MKTEKKHILVVDDQPRNTQLLKLYLERTNDYVLSEVLACLKDHLGEAEAAKNSGNS
jgi:CheY-like chemotaxis protein